MDSPDTTDRAHTDRLRYRARRLGLHAVKSRARDAESPWFGRWRLDTIQSDRTVTPGVRWMTTDELVTELHRREREAAGSA